MALPLAPFIVALAVPLVKKVLTYFGIGIISYAALTGIFSALQNHVNSSIGGITGDIYAICALYGVFDSISIIMSAISIKLSMTPLKRFGILP